MGGDHAPKEVVAGVSSLAPHTRAKLILVGRAREIEACLEGPKPHNVVIQDATEVVGMHETPTDALRKKRDSSISVGVRLVKEGLGDAFVSAGNTGAVTAACVVGWRPIAGLDRPAIATVFPNQKGEMILLDAGASPDVDPKHIFDFALMGRAYAEKVMGRANPTVHMVNIGEEPGKGNAFSKKTHDLLADQPWFAGNIEGKDLFRERCDVVVCDAFVGNVILKTAEGVAEFIMAEIKSAVPKGLGRLYFLPMRKILSPLRKKLDYAEYGGSPLLGLNHVCIICHGRSNAKAITNAIKTAMRALENGLVPTIREYVNTENPIP